MSYEPISSTVKRRDFQFDWVNLIMEPLRVGIHAWQYLIRCVHAENMLRCELDIV